jgi:hypothetical protein
MRYYSNLPESVLRENTMVAIKNGWYPSVPLWTQGTPAYNPGPMPLGELPMYLNDVPTFLNDVPTFLNGDEAADNGAADVDSNIKMKTGFAVLVTALAVYAGYKYYKGRKPSYMDFYA